MLTAFEVSVLLFFFYDIYLNKSKIKVMQETCKQNWKKERKSIKIKIILNFTCTMYHEVDVVKCFIVYYNLLTFYNQQMSY